ncbi:hypothetical protein A1O1_01032 [Capronia coronata CBS 617.96]|uniref:Uncharacterized protein n=1 Tax=Capronia coronata CBS 617.96 TaxID=1182541 RepID=W9YSQ7_9EURO|nr:uncharacterized protein A1O1_01032 [Capronia coronata CBS 617.96]EXJ95907.1 hypothetical protein A1O1_01032 [Capronia coronata CBS 617.96]
MQTTSTLEPHAEANWLATSLQLAGTMKAGKYAGLHSSASTQNTDATGLLLKLREGKNDRGFGILSSHPAAILAALRAFGRGIEEVDLKMAREHARAIMDCSPVGYVKEAVLRGGLFMTHGEDNVVCCAYTNFWVDHTEPLEVLQAVKARGIDWPFGDLPEGCEFLVMGKGGQVNPEGERIRKQLLSSEF